MVSRAAHYAAKAKHAQRPLGAVQPKLPERDTNTAWMGEFMSSIQGLTTPFNADAVFCLPLGDTNRERELRLRDLSKMGSLLMSAYRVNGYFVEYRWQLGPLGQW